MTAGRPFRPAILVRVAVAAALTGLLLWTSQPAAVAEALALADWRWIGAATLLVLIDRTLMVWRWMALLSIVPSDRRPPFAGLMRVFFVSTFVGTFLPASVGGDAVRAYGVSRLNVGGADAVASVLMDRLLGVASILLLAAVGLVLVRELATNPAVLAALIGAAILCGLMLAAVFSAPAARLIQAVVDRLPGRIQSAAGSVLASIRRYAAHHGTLGAVLAASVAVQVLRVLQAWCLGVGLGISASAAEYFAYVPMILLVMLLPVTVNGLGTSQAAFVWFFGRAGVPAAPAFALSILFVALGVVGNLPGGVLYATGGLHGRNRSG